MPRGTQVSTTFTAVDRMRGPMRSMQRNVSGFSRSAQKQLGGVSSSFQMLRRVAGAAAAAMGAREIARAVGNYVETAANVERTARQIGIGTEALQKLQFTAKQFGADTEAVRDGLKELSIRADEFATTGAGPAAEAMERLGLSQDEIASKASDTGKLFTTIRERLSEVQNVAARQRLADEIFGGTGGEQLVEVASMSTKAVNEFYQAAEDAGAIQSGKATQGALQFQNAMNQLRAAMQGARNNALAPLISELTPLINRMSEWVQENQGLIKQKVPEVFDRIRSTVQQVVAVVKRLRPVIATIIGGFVGWKIATMAVTARLIYLNAVMAVKKFVQLIRVIRMITKAKKGWAAAQAVLNVVMKANPIGIVITAIGALVGATLWLVANWDKASAFLSRVWDVIKQSFVALWNGLKIAFQSAVDFIWNYFLKWTPTGMIIQHWEKIRAFLAQIWGAISARVTAVFNPVGEFFKNLWGGIVGTFRSSANFIMGIVDRIIGGVREVIGFLGSMREKVSGFFSGVGEFLGIGGGAAGGPQTRGVAANQVWNRSESVSRSEVRVGFDNMPYGTSVRQRGQARGVTVDYGAAGAWF